MPLLAVLHGALAVVERRSAWRGVARDGVVGAIADRPDREAAFWFVAETGVMAFRGAPRRPAGASPSSDAPEQITGRPTVEEP